MDDWEKFNETSLSQKDITNVDNTHTKRVCKEFEKKLGEYHGLYGNFRNMFFKIFEIDPAKYSGLPWQAALKMTKVKLDFWTDFVMLIMAEKSIRGGICHSICLYAKANNRYMKNYDNNKKIVISSILGCK